MPLDSDAVECPLLQAPDIASNGIRDWSDSNLSDSRERLGAAAPIPSARSTPGCEVSQV